MPLLILSALIMILGYNKLTYDSCVEAYISRTPLDEINIVEKKDWNFDSRCSTIYLNKFSKEKGKEDLTELNLWELEEFANKFIKNKNLVSDLEKMFCYKVFFIYNIKNNNTCIQISEKNKRN